ncbi:hypothetical protein OZ401_000844 [Candidatus Chlorohelix allophototropha]|nr:hypothetical protein OZ401_000844 [Chloroflexota bacterium L227-S17]
MRVSYKDAPRYLCDRKFKNMVDRICLSVSAAAVEEVVVQAFFEAIRPAQLDALEAVLVAQEKERRELFRHWDEKLKRAQYGVQLAERQYSLVDPENRLVAGELEKRWENALIALKEIQEGYRRFETAHYPVTLPTELKEQFRRISESLPELWQSGQLDNAQKKDLLRSLVAKVIVDRVKSDTLELRVVWISGHYTKLEVNPPIHRTRDLGEYEELAERLQVLWKEGLTEQEIAEQVSREGYRSARSKNVSAATVRDIRLQYLKQHPEELNLKTMRLGNYLPVQELAVREGFKVDWVYRQIANKRIKPEYLKKHPRRHSYLIQDNAELIAQLRQYWQRKEDWLAKRNSQI